jgi:hypothetical protein
LNRLLGCILACCLLCGSAMAETAPPGPDAGSSGEKLRIAVFPMENLSGTPVPLKELTAGLHSELKRNGILTIEPSVIESFIEKHQVRYLGGIDEPTAAALGAETGAEAVLISTVELYSDVSPPKFSLLSRLVSLKGVPEIVWMDSVGMAGDDAPGILGLGLIHDLKELRSKGLGVIGTSLARHYFNPPVRKKRVSARVQREEEPFTLKTLIEDIRSEKRTLTDQSVLQARAWRAKTQSQKPYTVEDMLREISANGGPFLSRYGPLGWYSSGDRLIEQERTIAIIPFFNRSTRKHAAELQVLHLAKQLVRDGSFVVLELGVIRDKLLNMHIIMNDGISIPSLDLVSISLEADLLLNGMVFDYLDTVGYGSYPRIDFSMQMFDRDNKKVLWSSHSHNQGNDGVYFFEYGSITTAGALADKMCRALVLKLVEHAKI